MGNRTDLGMSFRAQEARTVLACGDDIKMTGKKKHIKTMSKINQKDTDLEDPIPLLSQVYVGYTQREGKVDHEAVQTKTELFERLPTTQETDEMPTGKYSLADVTVWSYNAEKERTSMSTYFLAPRLISFVLKLNVWIQDWGIFASSSPQKPTNIKSFSWT